MRRLGFTLIELIFVIVIIGILSKFGVEFLSQAYNNFIYSSINNSLQARSTVAIETIASRLQFRIKDSIIARQDAATFQALSGSTLDANATILEWVGNDVDGFRGNKTPLWSGVIDLDDSNATFLDTPETNTTSLNTLIDALSNGGSDINNSAIYFVGSDSDIDEYGWNNGGVAFNDQTNVMHPIRSVAGNINAFKPDTAGDFSGEDVYEYYQLAWTAYAVSLEDFDADGNANELVLYYGYQPWEGEKYTDGTPALLMENVSTFRFKAIGSVVKIQVCVKTDIIDGSNADAGGGYSLCKEKTIY